MRPPRVLCAAALVAAATCRGVHASRLRRLSSSASAAASPPCPFDTAYPQHYVAYATSQPPVLDGHLDEKLWQEVPWTTNFADISTDVRPRKDTKMKMRWDHEYLYVAAWMQEDEVWANVTKHDEVVFHDNDFEVFVDPSGSTHYYKEFEINALGTIWDLCINKPYGNGGYENSTRVYGSKGYEMGARAGVSIQDGRVNAPETTPKSWIVELALPISSLLVNQTQHGGQPPKHGRYWRINFSRVEWHVLRHGTAFWKDPAHPREDNWVWSPQGEIQMHLPERWGIMQFSEEAPTTTAAVHDPEWRIRYVAAAVYDAEQAYAKEHDGDFTADLKLLRTFAAPSTLDGVCTQAPTITLEEGGKRFTAHVKAVEGSAAAVIRQDRLLLIERQ